MADDKRYMGYWIGHLHQGERNRIHLDGPNHQESAMLAKGEDPWAKFRGPLPPSVPPYLPPTKEAEEIAATAVDELRKHVDHQLERVVNTRVKGSTLSPGSRDTKESNGVREPTEAEVLAIMHDDDLLEYTSSGPRSDLRRNSMFEHYKRQWKAARAAEERNKKVEALRRSLNPAPEAKSGSSEEMLDDGGSLAPELVEQKKPRSPIIVHLKEGLRWSASHLWSWTAILITAPLLYGFGVGAMYGQQPIIAACLYFFAIGLILAKAIAEARSHEQRVGVIVVVLILGTAVFGVSLLWIQHTSPDWLSSPQVSRTSPVVITPSLPSPTLSPSPLPPLNESTSQTPRRSRSQTRAKSQAQKTRLRKEKALRILHSP